MNSKQAAKFVFGNPGFFDFLAPVAKFVAPIVKQISPAYQVIDIAKNVTGVDVHQLAATQAPALAKVLDIAETVQGGAIAASAIAPFAPAAIALPSLGSLSTLGGGSAALSQLGNLVQDDPNTTDTVLGDSVDDGSEAEDDPLGEDGDY